MPLKDLYKDLKMLSAELIPQHNLKKQDEKEVSKLKIFCLWQIPC